jgi:hypothetical protein
MYKRAVAPVSKYKQKAYYDFAKGESVYVQEAGGTALIERDIGAEGQGSEDAGRRDEGEQDQEIIEHMGPGDHPSGSPQAVHALRRRAPSHR